MYGVVPRAPYCSKSHMVDFVGLKLSFSFNLRTRFWKKLMISDWCHLAGFFSPLADSNVLLLFVINVVISSCFFERSINILQCLLFKSRWGGLQFPGFLLYRHVACCDRVAAETPDLRIG